MLRIIVISLVVVNLLLLGFQSSAPTVQPEARPTSAVVKDSGIPTIHLFSEMMQDQGLMSGNRRCFTLGPFHSVADWDDVHLRLQEVATRISERQTEALVEKGYWVFMPPYPSLLEANKALLSLQALGLEDVAIMYDGEWKNSISLGYFMRQENAQRRKKALEDRGFKPMMRIQRQAEPRYWLDYEQEPGAGLVELDMQNRPNDFMQRPVPCPEAEFLEADATASQDAGENRDDAQALEGKTRPVNAGEEEPSGTGSEPAEPSVPAPDQPVDDKETASGTANEPDETPGGDGETTAGQAQATAADQAEDPPTVAETAKTTGDGVERVSEEVPDETTGNVDEPAPVEGAADTAGAAVETTPKQTVGTGPADIVSTESGPVDTSVTDQGAESPAARASENGTDAAEDTSTDDETEDPAKAPAVNSTDQPAPEGTQKDSGDGTVDER